MLKDEIKNDILAFADDDSEILFESNGDVMFFKNGTEQICRISTNEEGVCLVEYQDEKMPYRTFIAKHLAKLDLFARRIFEKRKGLEDFVDSPAIIKSAISEKTGKALELLQEECDHFLEFGSKINFITADAGHGKSALLRQFQSIQAHRYIKGESKYLFWHVDLQGRDLVRLGEAIMYDLGELRLPGLYYPSIVNLIQKRFIILAIDGFDELAAEIGGSKAVSSLSNFVNEMAGQGTLIAASRRTFFDTHDYLKRTSLLRNKVPFDICFNELKLNDWSKFEVINYFENHAYDRPEEFYSAILSEIHDNNHPVLTRPFLLAKLEAAIDGDIMQVSQFFSKEGKDNESVSYIVESFTRREVEKWKGVDVQTGKPYLSFEQHIQLLATIAKEMWDSKKDFVTIEEIEINTVLLFDDWKIVEDMRQIIVRIASSHAFLIPVNDSKMNARKFDHDEFKNYFLARAFAEIINSSLQNKNYDSLKRFLYIDQLPDTVAMYCFNYISNLNENIFNIIDIFKKIVNEEWKPTYLQLNIGTIIPFLLDKITFESPVVFDAKVNYSSLVFENKSISKVSFENGTFINISLKDTLLDDVHFINCEFNEIKIDRNSKIDFKNVSFSNSRVTSIILIDDGDISEIAFSPERINELLANSGIQILNGEHEHLDKPIKIGGRSEFKKTLHRFILKFNKMTIQYEMNIIREKYLGSNTGLVIDRIIPLCEQYKIIEPVETRTSKQSHSKAWKLLTDFEEILKYDGIDSTHSFSQFWHEVNQQK